MRKEHANSRKQQHRERGIEKKQRKKGSKMEKRASEKVKSHNMAILSIGQLTGYMP